MPAPLLYHHCAGTPNDGTILKHITLYMSILIHNVVRWPKQSWSWKTWTKTWWTNFWVMINCLSAYAGKQESLMMYFISFPSHTSWKFLLLSWPNNSVWSGVCTQMLTVKAYDVIARKYRLFCDEHEEQEVKITSRWQNYSGHRHCTGCR